MVVTKAIKFAAAVGLCGAAILAPGEAAAQNRVTHTMFGGISAEAQMKGLLADVKKLGIEVREERHGGWAGIQAHLSARAPGWDIISVGFARCETASQRGWIQPIDYSVVDRTRVPANLARRDYVGVFTFTFGIAFDRAKLGDRAPKSWADFWDVKRFPGRRSLAAEGLYALEAALFADGVPPADIYKVLKAPGGVDRAFAKLEKIKPAIDVWWKSTVQAGQLLRDGEVDMILIASSRAADLAKQGMDVGFVWNQAIIDVECFMIPRNAPNPKAAMQVINSALDARNQALHSSLIAYGPVNPRAFDMGIITPAAAAWLPTAPQLANVPKIYADENWYASKEATAAYQQFSRFLQ